MPDPSTDPEIIIRVGIFLTVFTIMAIWETRLPALKRRLSRRARWPANLGVVALNTGILRILFPTAAVGLALYTQSHDWGLFPWLNLPTFLVIIISVVLLDAAIYLQHVLFHAVPVLWRLHRMHHLDLDLDVTSGSRFHPIEIVLSMLYKFALIVALGAPPEAVLIFEIVLNAMAMFNHSNIHLPMEIDGKLQRLFVTPDMHRIHHSVQYHEANSNFGFNLSLWDRWFGTYTPRGDPAIDIGVRGWSDPLQCAALPGILKSPFISQGGDYAINRKEQ